MKSGIKIAIQKYAQAGAYLWAVRKILFAFCVLVLLLDMSCANPVAPTGGARDTTPPQLDSLKSTPNLSVNFDGDEIVLAFDEWVTLKDAAKQVLVSPPLDKPVKLTQKRKRIVVDLSEEELRENTTYTIQFGNAIQDLTEGNPFKSTFVFSTGPYVDSLELKGAVMMTKSGTRIEDALVLLHTNLSDTAFQKERPFYFTKSDKNGNFKFENLKGGSYRLYGLVDQNVNYLFDLESEVIAFNNEPIELNDSSQNNFVLHFFQESQGVKILSDKQPRYGEIVLTVSNTDRDYSVRFLDESIRYRLLVDGADLTIWYDSKPQKQTVSFELLADSEIIDTLSFENKSTARNEQLAALAKLGFKKKESGGGGFGSIQASGEKEFEPTLFHVDSSIVFAFSRPIIELNVDLIQLTRDTLSFETFAASISSDKPNRVLVSGKDLNPGKVEFQFLPGALTDIFGVENQDTIRKTISFAKQDDFGNIDIKLQMMNSSKAYILEIMTQTGARIYKEELRDLSEYKTRIKAIEPGKYRIKLTTDTNRNGQWDTGVFPNQQPETIVFGSVGTLRANWDLELKLVVDLGGGSE